jgi:hypothetical protein
MTWSCEKTRDILASGGTPSGADAERHLGECATCADLVDRQADAWLAELDGGAPNLEGSNDLDALFEQVQVSVDRDRGALGWLRSRSTPMRIAAALAVPAVLVAFQGLTKLRVDISVYPVSRMSLEIAALVVGTVGATLMALRPLQRTHRPAFTWAWLALVLAVPFLMAATGPAHQAHAASLEGVGDDFWPRALACFGYGVAMAAPAWLALALFDRQASKAGAVVLVAAAVSGLVGNFVLHVHCPLTDPTHLLVGHATVGIALLPIAAAIAWWRGRTV